MFDEREEAALHYAEAMTDGSRHGDGSSVARLRQYFSDDAIIELTALISAPRRSLVAATTARGGIGVTVAATPFIASMLPNERARGSVAPVAIDRGNQSLPGARRTRGCPI